MYQTFVPKQLTSAHREIVDAAERIMREYAAQGFDLTLRQLYYQFVARQPLTAEFANTQQSYKRLGKIVSDARLAGELDWSYIVDRTRQISGWPSWDDPGDILDGCARSYRVNPWENQPCYVEAWIEKEALAGVLESACRELRLPFFSCRGYASQSALYRAGQRFARRSRKEQLVVLHLGDHDPSGIDMTRDCQDRLTMFSGTDVRVDRLALTMDQVEELSPPPNPAKLTDSRASAYVAQYGTESWELDALPPEYITRLITEAAEPYVDRAQWSVDMARERADRQQLRLAADNWDEVGEFVADTFGEDE